MTGTMMGTRAAKRTVLSYSTDGDFLDQTGQRLDGASLKAVANKTGIYLLVPSELTMSRALSEPQKGLELATIAEQLLPFSASELIYGLDDEAQVVHVAVAEEMRVAYKAMLSHGVGLRGLAFLAQDQAGQERLCVSHELNSLVEDAGADELLVQANNTHQSKRNSSQTRTFALAFAPLVFCVLASALISYWLGEQRQELSRLEAAYSELIDDVSSKQAQPFLSLEALSSSLSFRQAEGLSAEGLRKDLTLVARNITESTEISQLIVTPAELILDASADSGSELQAQLDESKLFASTEFISSISQSSDGKSERFRLKLQRKPVKERGER